MKKKVIIVGGGTAGITTAAALKNKSSNFDITIIDFAKEHYDQPLWTLVG